MPLFLGAKSSCQTDLVDDDEDGVEEHQVVGLEGQVLVLLQGEQHRSYQGDLGGAANKQKRVCLRVCVWGEGVVRNTYWKTHRVHD